MLLDEQFGSVFRRPATIRVQSPGRINLIGEHVDYVDGCVMPVAIDRRITMLVAPCDAPEVRVWSCKGHDEEPQLIALDDLRPRTGPEEQWLNYLIGVLVGYRDAGVELKGFEAVLMSDLPTGAGLSSSAALATAMALTIEELSGQSKSVIDRALICQAAEHDFAGVPCGIMDQLAVGAGQAGHATLIDCRNLALRPIPIPAGIAIIVADSGVKHALGDGEYRKRREDCEAALTILGVESLRDATVDLVNEHEAALGDRLFRRARHVVTEMARVEEFAEALQSGDEERVGKLMREGHNSLRDDFEVSCVELDVLVDAAYEFGHGRGLLGSRMTGGGFGGSTVSLVRAEEADALLTYLEDAFEKRFGRTIEPFITVAANGARILTQRTPLTT